MGNGFFDFLKKLEKMIYQFLEILVSTGLVILLFLIAFQIISRYFRLQYLAPPDEIITLVYVWMLFIGAAILVRNNDHIKIELFNNFFDKHRRLNYFYNIMISLLIFFFLFIMMNSNWVLYQKSATRASPMLQLPQRLWYVVLLISGALMIFYLLIYLIRNCYLLFLEIRMIKRDISK